MREFDGHRTLATGIGWKAVAIETASFRSKAGPLRGLFLGHPLDNREERYPTIFWSAPKKIIVNARRRDWAKRATRSVAAVSVAPDRIAMGRQKNGHPSFCMDTARMFASSMRNPPA